MGEMLRNIKETPVSEEGLVDIRRLIASGAPFNLLLSFSYDKMSTRWVDRASDFLLICRCRKY